MTNRIPSTHAVNMFLNQQLSDYIHLKDFALALRRAFIETQRDRQFMRKLKGRAPQPSAHGKIDIEKKFEELVFQKVEKFAVVNSITGDIFIDPEKAVSQFRNPNLVHHFRKQMDDIGHATPMDISRCLPFMYLSAQEQHKAFKSVFIRMVWPITKSAMPAP